MIRLNDSEERTRVAFEAFKDSLSRGHAYPAPPVASPTRF
jgi:hypothetical protein